MKVSEQYAYDASPDAVWAMMIDSGFRDDVCRATGASSWEVGIDADERGGTVKVSRVVPAGVSDAVRKLVGETVTIVEQETWGPARSDRTRSADVLLEVHKQPARMEATRTVSASGGGSSLHVAGELTVSLPFVGRRIEEELAKAVTAALQTEHDVGRRYLA